MMRSRKVLFYIVSFLLILSTTACSDELGSENTVPASSGNLHVLVPLVHSSGTRAGEPNPAEDLTYNATEEECRINSLRLFAFPQDNNGTLVNEYLGNPGTSFYETGKFDGGVDVATYTLRITPGSYKIYVVANMEEVLKKQDITTEDELKQVVLYYRPETIPSMPVSGNIPMIYEPMEETLINATDKTTDIVANLKFTCAKVKLNLIFDSEAATGFNGNGLAISGISGNKLSPSSNLVWGGKFYASGNEGEEYFNGISSQLYTTSSTNSIAGSYYAEGEWTRNDANADISNKDVITINSSIAGKATPTDNKKWMFQGTYYLPERYIENKNQQSYLTINSKIGSNENNYKIALGHTGGHDEATKDLPTFPRGTYYEIIGNVKTLGNIGLDCQVHIKDWEPAEIAADFCHTTLWVSKTSASVTSLEEDFISYQSNWTNVEFGCDTDVDGLPLVIEDKREKNTITFKINPAIPMSAYGNGGFPASGKTKVWLKANNLKKYLDVTYNVEPLFEVNPLEVVIYYEDGAETNTKKFEWITNLGGIRLVDTTEGNIRTIGNSQIKILAIDHKDSAIGTFQVEAITNPVTTTIHTFRVESRDTYNGTKPYRDIKVTVRPPVKDYRIYFRAINDRAYNDKFKVNQFQSNLTEFYGTGNGNNNWEDGWDGQGWNHYINNGNHNVYIYSQIGETYGTSIPKDKVWYFNGYYNETADKKNMTGDTNNPGWYYKDMAIDAIGTRKDGDQSTTTIKPGETLMIFYSHINDGADLHRCPHHMEPGIPLFNYEDREGWILYDPTSDPYYRIFDEKPIIKDVTYTVYTKYKINGWACYVGVATDNPVSNSDSNAQFELWDNQWDGHTANNMTFSETTINNTKWYITRITLKAVDGYHAKCIRIKADNNDNGIEKTLFGGKSYEKYGDTGYFDNFNWYPGIPN